MSLKQKTFKERLAIISTLAIGMQFVMPLMAHATAASLSNTYVRLDRNAVSATSATVRLQFKTSSGNGSTVGKVVVTVPSGYTVATSGLSASTAGCVADTGDTALPGTLTVAGDNTVKTLTISGVTGAANSTLYCVDITGAPALTNPSSGGGTQQDFTVATQTSGAGALDDATVAEYLLANDQVSVNATVNPSFTFTLSGNSDTIPGFSSGSVGTSAGVTATVATNASKGWIAWAKSQNGALTSAAAGSSIATSGVGSASHAVNANADDYVLSVIKTTQTGASLTPDANYTSTGSDNKGGGLDTTKLRPLATETGPCSGDVITLKELATVSPVTPAANDYTDILTIIGAGQF